MSGDFSGKPVFIELTRVCNFTCDFCPPFWITRPSGVMSLDDLQRVLVALRQVPGIEYVMFSNLGEPLCHVIDGIGINKKAVFNRCVDAPFLRMN